MKLIAPNYYGNFHCKASECRHSCCVGWEIGIDSETLEIYRNLTGPLGDKIRENLILSGDDCCFRLDENERCPFLTDKGLCEIISSAGSDLLCGICAEHPRFYNEYSDRTETGIGLCCEEASEIIVKNARTVDLIVLEDDGEITSPYPAEQDFFKRRAEILSAVQDRTFPITMRLENVMKLVGIPAGIFSYNSCVTYFTDAEKLTGDGDVFLSRISRFGKTIHPDIDRIPAETEQLAVYFIYRHLTGALEDGRFRERTAFALLSVYTVTCAFLCGDNRTADELCDVARIYSADIEYSDKNIDKILCMLQTDMNAASDAAER